RLKTVILKSLVAECPHDDLMAEAEEEGFSNYRVVNRHFQLNTQASTPPSPNMPPKAYEGHPQEQLNGLEASIQSEVSCREIRYYNIPFYYNAPPPVQKKELRNSARNWSVLFEFHIGLAALWMRQHPLAIMDSLTEALSLVTQAVQFDTQGDFETACYYYQQGIINLERAFMGLYIPVERESSRKTLITQKLSEYKSRNDVLQEQMRKRNNINKSCKLLMQPKMNTFGVGVNPQNNSQGPPQMTPTTSQHVMNRSSSLSQLRPPYLMSREEAYSAAAELAKKATEEDQAGRYDNAYRYYNLAIDYLQRALEEEPDYLMKQRLIEAIGKYTQQAEGIRRRMGLISNVNACVVCNQVIDGLSSYKVAEDKKYHIKCFEATRGLDKEATKTFMLSDEYAYMRVKLPKKNFTPGETIRYSILVENRSSKTIKNVTAYLVMSVSHAKDLMGSQTKLGYGVERKVKTKENKFGRREYFGTNNQFPLAHGEVEIPLAEFTVPIRTSLTEISGPYAREFQLVVKCVFGKATEPLKITFPVHVVDSE
ncbi:hypothetical protein PROFUN_14734, partial [Planoprotostelium fungivorum]